MTESHVAIVAFPFSSHASSLFSLVRAMAAVAPSSHFSFVSTKRSLSSFKTHQLALLPNISLIPISDGITPPHVASTHFEAIELFLKSFKDNLRDSLKAAELAQGCQVRCLVSDLFVWLAADVAHEMSVKWVPVRTGSPLDLYARLNADLIKEIVGVGDEAVRSYGDKLLSFLPCLSNHRASDLPYGLNTGDPNFVYHVICDRMARKLRESDVLVTNTIEGLEPNLDSYFKQNFANYFAVGPFHLLNYNNYPSQKDVDVDVDVDVEPPTDSYNCLSWLDRHQPATVAYVSLGTLALLGPCELTSLANGLEASGVPFLWSLKEETQSLLPSGFIDRMNETGKGKIVPWAPQTSVLKHSAVGAFVSHCGWNSVLESIVGGVPLVCRPFFGDQTINTRLVSYVWKVGVALEDPAGVFTEKNVVRAFDEVFKRDPEEGNTKMKNKMNELKDMVIAAVAVAVGVGENIATSRDNFKRLMNIVCGS